MKTVEDTNTHRGLRALSEQEPGGQTGEAGMGAYLQKRIDPFAIAREVMRRIGYGRQDGPCA